MCIAMFQIAEGAKSAGVCLLAGSAGLAAFLPIFVEAVQAAEAARPGPPLLFLVGSVHRAAIDQTDHAAAQGICCHTLQPEEIFAAKPSEAAIAAALETLRCNKPFILRCVAKRGDIAEIQALAEASVIPGGRVAALAGECVAAFAQAVTKQLSPTLAVFGGDTLLSVMKKLSIPSLRPKRELLEGVVYASAPGYSFITKAGGFGEMDIISKLCQTPVTGQALCIRKAAAADARAVAEAHVRSWRSAYKGIVPDDHVLLRLNGGDHFPEPCGGHLGKSVGQILFLPQESGVLHGKEGSVFHGEHALEGELAVNGPVGGVVVHGPNLVGIVQVGLAYVCFTKGIKRTAALLACLITALEPVLNPVWVALATGERPGTYAFAGGAIIFIAVLGYNIWTERSAKGALAASKND